MHTLALCLDVSSHSCHLLHAILLHMQCVNTSTIFNDASTVQYAQFVYQIACGRQVLQSEANAQCSLLVLSMLTHSMCCI
jgi:hypothetical protein